MEKANKKSLDAKAYINAQVNEMREKIRKAPDEETRQQLIENFNELTSSDEYQKNLAIVQEDTDAIRKDAQERKGGSLIPEEFGIAKTEFYGKDMELKFGEDFEKLDLGKKVNYIFEKFGDTDYAADLMIGLIDKILNNANDCWLTITSIIEDLNDGKNFEDKYPMAKDYYRVLSEKFGTGPVTLRLYFYFGECLGRIYAGNYEGWFEDGLISAKSYNITENTLKKIFKTKSFMEDGYAKKMINWNPSFQPGLLNIINGCDNGSISDAGLIEIFVDMFHPENLSRIMEKLSSEGQKYLINYSIKTLKQRGYIHDWLGFDIVYRYYNIYNNSANSGEGVDTLECIINSMLDNLDDVDLEHFCEDDGKQFISNIYTSGYKLPYQNKFLSKIKDKHKQVVDIFIKAGKIDLVKKYINNFTGLTEEEKSEIMGK